MKLFEVFNNVLEWDYTENDGHTIEAEFVAGGVHYIMMIHKTADIRAEPGERVPPIWHMEFSSHDGTHDDLDSGITGSGNAFQVFATVIDMFNHITHDHPDIKTVSFSATEPSRQSLYKRWVKQLATSGWKVQSAMGREFPGIQSHHHGDLVWIVER